MGMPQTARRYTVEEVLGFPDDGNRYEVVHGELLVTPAPRPRHQMVLQRLLVAIHGYLDAFPERAVVLPSPADITWGEEILVQPDLFVVPREQVSNNWDTYKTLLLAVEILSPGTSRADRVVKRRLYQEHAVGAYWIVDPEAQIVEVWHPEDVRPEIVTEVLRWGVAGDAPECEIELSRLFSDLPE